MCAAGPEPIFDDAAIDELLVGCAEALLAGMDNYLNAPGRPLDGYTQEPDEWHDLTARDMSQRWED